MKLREKFVVLVDGFAPLRVCGAELLASRGLDCFEALWECLIEDCERKERPAGLDQREPFNLLRLCDHAFTPSEPWTQGLGRSPLRGRCVRLDRRTDA